MKTLSSVVGAEGFGAWPVLKTASLGAAQYSFGQNANRVEGFNGDGDSIELPSAAVVDIEYFNSSDVLQFGIALSDVDASANFWIGFFFDAGIIYGVAVNTATTPDTFFSFTVDSAGTVVNIGNDQPGVDFNNNLGTWWNDDPGVDSSTIIYRKDGVGSGNIIIQQSSISGVLSEAEINITTGLFVSDPATFSFGVADTHFVKSDLDNYLAFSPATDTIQLIPPRINSIPTLFTPTLDEISKQTIGYPLGVLKPTQWKSRIYAVSGSTSAVPSIRSWPRDNFLAFIDLIATVGGY